MRLNCVNIVSADPRRLEEFYRTVLGLEADESHGGPQRIELWCGSRGKGESGDRTVLIVVHRDDGHVPQASNACRGFEFQVSDANAEYRRIQSLGVEVKEPPRDLPWGYRYFHVKDPDGNGVDVVQSLRA